WPQTKEGPERAAPAGPGFNCVREPDSCCQGADSAPSTRPSAALCAAAVERNRAESHSARPGKNCRPVARKAIAGREFAEIVPAATIDDAAAWIIVAAGPGLPA